MTHWTAFERRLRDTVLVALLPPTERVPGYEPAAHRGFWAELSTAAPPLLRLGLRASIWVVWLSALFRGRRFGRMTGPERAALVTRLESSRSYALRQVPMALKVVLSFAHFQRPEVRASVEPR